MRQFVGITVFMIKWPKNGRKGPKSWDFRKIVAAVLGGGHSFADQPIKWQENVSVVM